MGSETPALLESYDRTTNTNRPTDLPTTDGRMDRRAHQEVSLPKIHILKLSIDYHVSQIVLSN